MLDAPLWALGDFALAGLLHFLAGWSLLNLSQQRIGAARTSPLLTTVPVFGVVIAAVTIGQLPGAVTLVAIALMCAGAYVVAMRGGLESPRVADALPGPRVRVPVGAQPDLHPARARGLRLAASPG